MTCIFALVARKALALCFENLGCTTKAIGFTDKLALALFTTGGAFAATQKPVSVLSRLTIRKQSAKLLASHSLSFSGDLIHGNLIFKRVAVLLLENILLGLFFWE